MFVAPSSHLLIHKHHFRYSNHILRKVHAQSEIAQDDANSPFAPQVYLDLSFLCFSGDNPLIRKSPCHASLLLSSILDSNSGLVNFEVGNIAVNAGDYQTAKAYFTAAARYGYSPACNAIGLMYLRHFFSNSKTQGPGLSLSTAIDWFSRGYRTGSIESFFYLGEAYSLLNRKHISLYFYLQYFNHTHSPTAAGRAADLLLQLDQLVCGFQFHRHCATLGCLESARRLFGRSKCPELWASVMTDVSSRFELPADLRAHLKADFSLPPVSIQEATSAAKTASRPKTISEKGETFQNSPNFQSSQNFQSPQNSQNSQIESLAFAKPESSIVLGAPDAWRREIGLPLTRLSLAFPACTKTEIAELAFRFASPDIDLRNLCVCKRLLDRLSLAHPRGLAEYKPFRYRCEHGSAGDLVSCGFLSMLIGDNEYATSLFKRAAFRGSPAGALMAGFLLFHDRSHDNARIACYLLGKCPMDPLALLHLGVACKEQQWLSRACVLLGCPEDLGCALEWAGDILSQGVKIPRFPLIAMMFYSLAVKEKREHLSDSDEVVKKMAFLSREIY